MKTIRVTQLENFRRFRDDVPGSSEQQVIDSITGKFDGNDKTNIGSAFHAIIENPVLECLLRTHEFKKLGVTFSDEQLGLALIHAQNLGLFTPEIQEKKIFETDSGKILITGKMDVLQGNVIRDTKITFGQPEMQKYADSIQWKLYLSIFELDKFVYDVFEVIGYDEIMGRDISKCEIKQHEPFECFRYENMETDINNLLYSFCQWVDYRCLWHLVPDVK